MTMEQSPLLQSINDTPFFNVFSAEEKNKLVERSGMFKRYEKKGLKLFSEGDKGDSLFVILSGTIQITKLITTINQETNEASEGQKHSIIAKIESGSVLGEIAMLTGQNRTTYAFTGSPLVIALEINQDSMYNFNLSIQNKFNKQLLATLIGRINSINKKFAHLKEESLKIKKECSALKSQRDAIQKIIMPNY
jgi:CRP-like cAMP-binding protein